MRNRRIEQEHDEPLVLRDKHNIEIAGLGGDHAIADARKPVGSATCSKQFPESMPQCPSFQQTYNIDGMFMTRYPVRVM